MVVAAAVVVAVVLLLLSSSSLLLFESQKLYLSYSVLIFYNFSPILWASSNTTTDDLANSLDTKSAILGSSK